MRYLLIVLLLGLAACDGGSADVTFAEPLPAGAADLDQFPSRHQGVYVQPGDTTQQLEVLPTVLRRRLWIVDGPHSRHDIDTVLRDALAEGAALTVRTEPAGPDSVRLVGLFVDTIFRVGTPAVSRLRHQDQSYYLNEASDTLQTWRARRLEIQGRKARLFSFTDDTVRLLENGMARVVPRRRPLYIVQLPVGSRLLRDTVYWQPDAHEPFEWRRPSGRR
jgi:hypothetical protein